MDRTVVQRLAGHFCGDVIVSATVGSPVVGGEQHNNRGWGRLEQNPGLNSLWLRAVCT